MGFQLPNYPNFENTDDPSVAFKWEDWLDGFEALITAMKITESSEKEAILIHYAVGECRRLLEKPKESNKYVKTKSALTSYFSPKMNRVY